ncbi:Gfo/Idh/MocA family oxidoreductase [Candidatus Falkowbacteria bacterium]|nr:Gfo/Idh/MocA family oxidoreductase [Candidatus Falkowbacteria bacterium]
MKILIIGFGSIGQRHYKNLKKLGHNNIYVFDVEEKRIKNQELRIKNVNRKVLEDFDVVFVCTPNHLHIKYALMAAKVGCHLFIEKPLSHNLNGVKELISICRQKKLINMVACNMRFNPGLKFIKNHLEKNKLGKIYGIHHEFGYYLPNWRPGQDYRKNYAAKKSMGGGIILDDIHEFDLLFWLNDFSKVLESKFIFDKVSDLKIETEDSCVASFKFSNNILGSVRCDYLQKYQSRNCKVIGQKGNLEWDYKDDVVYLKNDKGTKKLFELKRKNDNNDYIAEIKYFLDSVEKKHRTFNDISAAFNLLSHLLKK